MTTPTLVEPVKTYVLKPGDSHFYDVGVVHSPKRDGLTKLVRIEGRNLDHVKALEHQGRRRADQPIAGESVVAEPALLTVAAVGRSLYPMQYDGALADLDTTPNAASDHRGQDRQCNAQNWAAPACASPGCAWGR